MRMKLALSMILLSPLLMGAKSGCLGFGAEPETTVVDTFCLTAKKRKWSYKDSADTIRDIHVANQVIDRRCGVGKVPSE